MGLIGERWNEGSEWLSYQWYPVKWVSCRFDL